MPALARATASRGGGGGALRQGQTATMAPSACYGLIHPRDTPIPADDRFHCPHPPHRPAAAADPVPALRLRRLPRLCAGHRQRRGRHQPVPARQRRHHRCPVAAARAPRAAAGRRSRPHARAARRAHRPAALHRLYQVHPRLPGRCHRRRPALSASGAGRPMYRLRAVPASVPGGLHLAGSRAAALAGCRRQPRPPPSPAPRTSPAGTPHLRPHHRPHGRTRRRMACRPGHQGGKSGDAERDRVGRKGGNDRPGGSGRRRSNVRADTGCSAYARLPSTAALPCCPGRPPATYLPPVPDTSTTSRDPNIALASTDEKARRLAAIRARMKPARPRPAAE